MRLVSVIAAALFAVLSSTQVMALDATKPGGLLPLQAMVPAPSGAKGLCVTYPWACAAGTSARLGAEQMEIVVAINRSANGSIRAVTDLAQYNVAEKWTLPTARGGDCEDFALYKKAKLIKAGISPDRLLLAAVLDRQGNSHAVLVLHTDTVDLVLDNLKTAVKRWDETGYTFLRMQDPRDPQRWVAVMAGGVFTGLSS